MNHNQMPGGDPNQGPGDQNDHRNGRGSKNGQTILIFLVVSLVVLLLINFLNGLLKDSTEKEITYNQFMSMLENGEVDKVVIQSSEIEITPKNQPFPGMELTYYTGVMADDNLQEKLEAGLPYVIRQRIPAGTTTFHDAIFGDITVDNSTLDDQVLLKRDGLPTYNFANVIDDHLMGITHVVRGSEYLASAPKYNLLYEAFGWEVPTYVHCSPVMRDAQNKMSKRHGDPSYEDLKAEGYLTEAILNYVALLGWSPKGELAEQELFTLPELVKAFDMTGISKSPAIFDRQKLDHFNAVYLRGMAPEAFAKAAEPYIRQTVKDPRFDTAAIAALLQARCEKLTDIPEKVDFFDALPEYPADYYTNKKSKTNPDVSRAMLEAVIPVLEGLTEWTDEAIHDALVDLAQRLEVKNATLMWPVRIAAAGKLVTPGGAVEICRILGKDETLRRLNAGLAMLGA